MTLATTPPPATIHLRRCDHARNMARFYRMSIVTDLFGGVLLLREWGRIGTRGSRLGEDCADLAEASARLAALVEAKRRRGYVAMPA